MTNEDIFDTLEIADLEQDIGGMCAVEPAECRTSSEGILVVMVLPPK